MTSVREHDALGLRAPGYMAAFRCIGPACPETCCAGWSVVVDRATFERWQTVRLDDALAAALRRQVHARSPDAAQERAWAEIDSTPDGRCSFLSDDKLCRIQSALGPEHLAAVCDEFPRLYRRRGDVLTVHASLACPEAARLALADGTAMEECGLPLPKRLPAAASAGAGSGDLHEPARRLADAARRAVSCDGVPVRFAWLYFVCALQEGARAQREGGEAALRTEGETALRARRLADHVERAVAPGVVEALARAAGPDDEATLFRLLRFVETAVRSIGSSPVRVPSLQLAAQCWNALEFDAADAPGSVRRFVALRERWTAPFEAEHPHVSRNWLLNNLGLHGFPGAAFDELPAHAMGFYLRLMLFETLMVGCSALRRERFAIDDCVAVAQALARHVEHERSYRGTPLMGRAA